MLVLTLAVASWTCRFGRRDALLSGSAMATLIGHASSPSAATAAGAARRVESLAADGTAFTWEEVPGLDVYNTRRRYALVTHANGARGLVCSEAEGTRCDLALTVPCGSLYDPPNLEGLAHLAEHVTLARDPLDLAGYVDERQGDVNAFTGERTTTFYTSIDLNKRISRVPSADRAEMLLDAASREEVSELAARFVALFSRALTGPAASAAPPEIIKQEIVRVDAELADIATRPSRRLLEVATLKARASDESAWRRLGRGSKSTLRLDRTGESELSAASEAVHVLCTSRYLTTGMTYAAVTPLPLADAVARLGAKFSQIPPAAGGDAEVATSPLSTGATATATTSATVSKPPSARASAAAGASVPDIGAAASDTSTPFPDLGRAAGGAFALRRPGRLAVVTLAWECLVSDVTSELRQKPLDMLGHVLTDPNVASLSSVLRARGLSPMAVELEPVVRAVTVARADEWVLWQLELTLAEGAEARWREAAGLGVAAVERLAQRGVPPTTAAEVQRVSKAAWRYSSRPPTAVELSTDLQSEPSAEFSVIGSREYIGEPAALARAASAAASQLAARSPIITVYSESLDTLGVESRSRKGLFPALPSPLDSPQLPTLTPLRFSLAAALAALTSAPYARYSYALRPTDLLPPPSNPWVPLSIEPSSPAALMPRRTYRIWRRELDAATAGATAAGGGGRGGETSPPLLTAVQLPGCVERRTLSKLAGSRAALADAFCIGQPLKRADGATVSSTASSTAGGSVSGKLSEIVIAGPRGDETAGRPLAVAVLEIESPVPEGASAAQAARAELWRLTLVQALAEQSALAARGGLKCDISFNRKGMRLVASGYSQRVPELMAQLLSRTLRHSPASLSALELAAARRAALSAARQARRAGGGGGGGAVGGEMQSRLTELQSCSAEQMQAEIGRLFRSARSASLLLAGDVSAKAAERLVAAVESELRPLLGGETVAAGGGGAASSSSYAGSSLAPPDVDVEEELQRWAGLLYKPTFTSSLATNACYDPAIARALDQCGTI